MAIVPAYSPLSTLIKLDFIPDQLQFVKDKATDLLDNIFYRNLTVQRSKHGDEASYSLELILYKDVDVPIFGSGLVLKFNPPLEDNPPAKMIVVPAKFHYKWEILRFIPGFNLAKFASDPKAMLDLALEILGLTEENLVKLTIETFITDPQPLNAFITAVNNRYTPSPLLTAPSSGSTTPYQDIVDSIYASTDLQDASKHLGLPVTPTRAVLEIYILPGDPFGNIDKLFKSWSEDSIVDKIKELLIPTANGSFDAVVGVEFPRNVLLPLDAKGKVISGDVKSMLVFKGVTFKYKSDGYSGFEGWPAASLNHPSQIGNTGFTIDIQKAKLDLTPGKGMNIAEADKDGRPENFTGIYIDSVDIGLPGGWNVKQRGGMHIKGKEILIGTGGFSGTISLEPDPNGPLFLPAAAGSGMEIMPAADVAATNPVFQVQIADGFIVELEKLQVTLKQNEVTASTINGTLIIPGFTDDNDDPVKIGINISIDQDGFKITGATTPPIKIHIKRVLTISIDKISVGKKDDRYFLDISGKLQFEDQGGVIGKFLPSELDVRKLLIWQDGQIEFEGGSLVLPKAVSVAIGPVKLSVTALHIGTHEQMHDNVLRKYKYFGFDGGINVNPGGVDARGDGIKFYFTTDGGPLHVFMRIQSIAVDIVIPGNARAEDATLLLSGYLSMKDPANGSADSGTEYIGGVKFTLPKLKMGGSAAMRLNPKKGAFLVDIGLELSTPILLGSTGLGIYGFRGLIGQKYVADKSLAGATSNADVVDWWEYYKAKVSPDYKEGIQVSKFKQKDGFSVGAGVSLATAGDSGRVFSSKLFLLLSLPEVLLLQGQAAVLSQRVGLNDVNDPPFSALLSIDRCSVQAGFGVHYNLPAENGEILKIDGEARLGFFSCGGTSWYINVGEDEPANKRIRARIFSLLDAYAYLMLSASGIRAGAGASWEFKKSYGPVGVELGAYIDTGGRISFKPVQIGAFLRLGGYARIKVFRFKFGFEVSASLSGEAPKPFIVTGTFSLSIDLPRPFKDINIDVDLTWRFRDGLNLDEVKLLDIGSAADPQKQAAKALNIMTQEPFNLVAYNSTSAAIPGSWPAALNNHIVPMDSYIDIEFNRGVLPDAGNTSIQRFGQIVTAVEHHELVPPQKAKNDQVKHEFFVRNIFVKYWDNGSWKDYDIYLAQTPLRDIAHTDMAVFQKAKYGYFQMTEPNKYTKLRVLAQTPLSYMTQGAGGTPIEDMGFPGGVLFCEDEGIAKICSNWRTPLVLGSTYSAARLYSNNNLAWRATTPGTIVAFPNVFGVDQSMRINQNGEIEIFFSEPVSYASLKLSTLASNVTVKFYARKVVDVTNIPLPSPGRWNFGSTPLLPVDMYGSPIYTLTRSYLDLTDAVVFDGGTFNPKRSIDKIVITPSGCIATATYWTGIASKITTKKGELQTQLLLKQVEADAARAICDKASECDEYCADHCSQCGASGLTELCNQADALDLAVLQIQGELQKLNDYLTAIGNGAGPAGLSIAPCTTYLHEICYLYRTHYELNLTIPGSTTVRDAAEDMVESLTKVIQPIWRPNTYFAIQIQTEDSITSPANGPSYSQYYTFGFKTGGPIGHFHQLRSEYRDLVARDRQDEYKLATLKHYIDYSKSYPNADGNIIGAKPLYYEEPRLLLFYKQAYVYAMYSNWDTYGSLSSEKAMLEVLIKDPGEPRFNGDRKVVESVWVKDDNPRIEEDVWQINNLMLFGANCLLMTGPVKRPGMHSEVPLRKVSLEPLKLYSVMMNSSYNSATNEVHRYVFQTSRYGSFAEHISSYLLSEEPGNEKRAVYHIDNVVTVTGKQNALDLLNNVSNATQQSLQAQYQHRFDRLVDGALRLRVVDGDGNSTVLDPAERTEFNIVTLSGTVIGILVRSPEPFNDPKIPEATLATSISVVHIPESNPTTENKVFTLLFSKDASQVFITNSAMNIPAGDIRMTFKYLEYDGKSYVERESALVKFRIP